MSIDSLNDVAGPSEEDMEYEAGYDDGVSGDPRNGDSPSYLQGYSDGVEERSEDYMDWDYVGDDDDDEAW